MKYWILLFICYISSFAFAQQDKDTSSVLTQKQFYSWVVQYHPMAKKANLLSEKGKQSLKAARGNFDPYIDLFYQQKKFKGKEYYEYSQNALKIPTWFGLDVETGWDFADKNGIHFNDEYYTSSQGTGYLGLSMPLAQGLLIDYRRAELKKAKIYQEASEIERVVLLNDLLLHATQTYWDWVKAYYNLKIARETLDNSLTRFKAVKNTYLGGDMAGMDTLEAFLQVQSITYLVNEASVKFQNQAWLVSNFLWTEDQKPIEITIKTTPPLVVYQRNKQELSQLQGTIDKIVANHPQIKLYDFKRSSLEIDKRFKADKLKPKLKLKYQVLSENYGVEYSPKDYKWGLSFQFPLFLRTERANLALVKIKLQEVELGLQQKNRELIAKLQTTGNKLENIAQQIILYESAVDNYRRLLKAEEIKMLYGESSLFKVNSREQKLVNAEQKLMELKVKYYQTKALLAWVSGVLHLKI